MARSLHFATTVPSGRDKGAITWKLPEAPRTLQDRIAYNFETVRIAEAGKFDAVLYADVSFSIDPEYWRVSPSVALEALTLFAAFSSVTKHIGLVPTLSSTFDVPFHVARRTLSLDHLSGGRAGLNVVTSFNKDLAIVTGTGELPSHSERYRRADEFTQIVKSLWDGFEDDATVLDVEADTFTDPKKIHSTDFKGEFFDIKGVIGSPRSVQGRPVLFQAGSSLDGVAFGVRHADVVFTSQKVLEKAVQFRRHVIDQAIAHGRPAPLVLPGLNVILGATEEEAKRTERRYIDAAISPDWLKNSTIIKTYFDPEDIAAVGSDLDAPLPPFRDQVEEYQTAFLLAKQQVGDRQITVREFFEMFIKGDQFAYWVGTPEQIADEIERWFNAEAADGFILIGNHDLNAQLKLFTEGVVPILQDRGLFRKDYEGVTLRDHLGLEVPENLFLQTRTQVSKTG